MRRTVSAKEPKPFVRGPRDDISLLAFVDLKPGILKKLLKKYDPEKSLWKTIGRTLRESRTEYKTLGLSYEKDGAKLREFLERKLVI